MKKKRETQILYNVPVSQWTVSAVRIYGFHYFNIKILCPVEMLTFHYVLLTVNKNINQKNKNFVQIPVTHMDILT
jgi:hypothetical protein